MKVFIYLIYTKSYTPFYGRKAKKVQLIRGNCLHFLRNRTIENRF